MSHHGIYTYSKASLFRPLIPRILCVKSSRGGVLGPLGLATKENGDAAEEDVGVEFGEQAGDGACEEAEHPLEEGLGAWMSEEVEMSNGIQTPAPERPPKQDLRAFDKPQPILKTPEGPTKYIVK